MCNMRISQTGLTKILETFEEVYHVNSGLPHYQELCLVRTKETCFDLR